MSHRITTDTQAAVGPAQWIPPLSTAVPTGDGPAQYIEPGRS